MRINLVFFLTSGALPGYYREFTEVYEITKSAQLEAIYKKASEWCCGENHVLDPEGQDEKKPKWDWLVRYGEDEKNIDSMLLLQIVEAVEGIMNFWEKNGRQAKKYEV